MRYAIFFILLLTNLSLSAQTFTGKVKDKKGELLVGASVVASTETSQPWRIVSQAIRVNIS